MNASELNKSCLKGLDFGTLANNQTGLERETLRVLGEGRIASTPHPAAIGHKLTHPSITVDFSEGLLELVTAPHVQRQQMRDEAEELHRFVARNLPEGEYFWALSMPPPAQEQAIQIAEFGRSPSGLMKRVYRQGLATRYGKIMQIISGVHYNFSFDQHFIDHMHGLIGAELSAQECRNRLYFRLIRGFDRHAWLLPYLFGASPVAAKSSLARDTPWLRELDGEHVYGEFTTSLRMSDIGYQSPAQADLNISHRSLRDYVRELVLATRTPWPDYESRGVRDGEAWRQLNGNILQIENEYYSAIRPKQIVQRGERPACALFDRGVRYIEVRMLDVDPFEPSGIGSATAHFMEVFLLACLAWGREGEDSSQIDKTNQKLAIRYGRQTDLKLMRGASSIPLRAWADEFLDQCAAIAASLDAARGVSHASHAVDVQREKWRQPERLPSQRVLDESSGVGYRDWARQLSQTYTADFARAPMSPQRLKDFARLTEQSFAQLAALEAQDQVNFADYVQHYFDSLCGEHLLD